MENRETLYLCAHIALPSVARFILYTEKGRHFDFCHVSDEDGLKKNWKSSRPFFFLRSCLVCLCETRGQLLLHGWNNLNVNASRLARCKIITVLCVLAIRCRSVCTLFRLSVIILAVCQFGFLTAAVVFKENWGIFYFGFVFLFCEVFN